MADEISSGPESSPGTEESREPSEPTVRHRAGLTPEQRRFLNQPRSAPNESVPAAELAQASGAAPEPPQAAAPARRADPHPTQRSRPAKTKDPGSAAPLPQADNASRKVEVQQAVLILGGIVLLGLAFYGGTKLNYIKYLIAARNAPKLDAAGPDRYAGMAAEDLIKQALIAERAGQWQEAADYLMAAKRKDLGSRGILFRVGKILYDHRNFETADEAFARAIAFGENVEAANFYRGLIAVRLRKLEAAERFFGAAASAAPFVPDYHYYWGEALRLDLKPEQSLPHYEKAILLARNHQDASVCQFKIRMARIEAVQGSAVSAELAAKESSGPLSVDWLMTAAALELRAGHIDSARQLIMQARSGNAPGLFASCVGDFYFHEAAEKFPELAEALHLDLDLQVPFPN